jgi:Mce-associated membrane protein
MADDAPSGEPEEPGESDAAPGLQTEHAQDADGSDGIAEDVPAGTSPLRLATIVGLVVVVALAVLTGWLGFRANQSRHLEQQREAFLEVGRQAAVNLTTLDYEHIDAEVQRILDSAAGNFYDEFQQRAPAFIDVVKQVKSSSVGTVMETALESSTPTEAEVLVAVGVTSKIAGQSEQPPRAWRMRILVQKIDDDTKVSNVEFVP